MSYLSYEKLGFGNQETKTALIKTARKLEAGRIKFHHTRGGKERRSNRFNMARWFLSYRDTGKRAACGCIGGWTEHFAQGKFEILEPSKSDRLFFPHPHDQWGAIRPKEAVKAIRNFLRTGKPQWRKILQYS